MSTRGCYRFTDGGSNQGPFTVYKHSDNYPYTEHGGIAAIAKAVDYAWGLPRFEADEFAAAFVSANKPSRRELVAEWKARGMADAERYAQSGAGGQVRLLNTPGDMTLDHMPGDIEYLYDVTCRKGQLFIVVAKIGGGFGDDEMTATPIAEGTLDEMLERFREWPKEDAD